MSTSTVRGNASRNGFWLAGTTANTALNLILFAALTVWVPCASPQQKAQNPVTTKESRSPDDVDKGKRLYIADGCYECHGYQGQGSTSAGPRIAPAPVPMDAFVAYLRRPSGEMPPYTEHVISNADLANIRAFLATIPKAPNPSEIPLLK